MKQFTAYLALLTLLYMLWAVCRAQVNVANYRNWELQSYGIVFGPPTKISEVQKRGSSEGVGGSWRVDPPILRKEIILRY